MDLTDRIKEFRSRQRNVLSWLFTSMLPQRVIVVCGSRLKLLLIGQVLVRQQLLCAAITTETEGEAALKAHQPGLLVVADPLEEGDVFNLCRKARQQQPNVKILLILSKENAGSAFQEIDALVDAAIYELDLGGEDYPLVKAFMAILRAGRYRSPSLQQPQHGLNVPPALEHEQPSSEPQLTPREQEVLDLIGRGLSDRQIGTSLGLSYETARTYVKIDRRKLGSNNRLAVAAWSWRRRPGSPPPQMRGGSQRPFVRLKICDYAPNRTSKLQLLESLSKDGLTESYASTPPSFMKDSKKSVKKLSVLLSSELHQRSKRQALLNDQSLTDLIVSLLTNYLDSVDTDGQEKTLQAEGGNKNQLN